jgi:hypothetical protein
VVHKVCICFSRVRRYAAYTIIYRPSELAGDTLALALLGAHLVGCPLRPSAAHTAPSDSAHYTYEFKEFEAVASLTTPPMLAVKTSSSRRKTEHHRQNHPTVFMAP